MNKYTTFCCIAIFLLSMPASAQVSAPRHFAEADQMIRELYAVISGPAGERDWEKMEALFHPAAIMGALRKNREGLVEYHHFTLDEYIRRNAPYFLANGFYESEIDRSIQEYGELMHVFSAYESRHNPDGPVFMRGINSIQLIHDKGRWWIISIQWNAERDDLPLPENLN